MIQRIDGLDKGDFEKGKLAWDVLRMTGNHNRSLPTLIDLSQCMHLKSYSLACIAAVGARGGKEIHLVLPENPTCREHCLRHGVHKWFNISPSETVSAKRRSIPIQQLRIPDGPGDFSRKAMAVWKAELGNQLSVGLEPTLQSHLDELIMNALGHSNSPVGCFVIGQGYPHSGVLELCVLDLGVTIRSHLTKNPKYAAFNTDENAIKKAMELGVTGTLPGSYNLLGEPNSGVGLATLHEFCETGNCSINVISGESCVCFLPTGETYPRRLKRHFAGTLVDVKFYTREELQPSGSESIL
jgi:hypothetical protein